MTTAYIEAIASALPAAVVTNEELARRHPTWRMDDVARRTGVLRRHWCGPDETALDLAETAVSRLIERTGRRPEDIDTILFCTQTPDYAMPANACLLQARLGFPTTTSALDFTHACSGFLYGLFLSRALIDSGAARRVLLVTAETYSKRFSPEDRGPATLFGDGAAATMIASGHPGIGQVALGTDGSAYQAFYVPGGGARAPEPSGETTDRHGNQRGPCDLFMDGAAVLSFVTRELPPHICATLAREGISWDDLALVVFHQASKVSLDALARVLKIPSEKVYSNLAMVGNTVSASVPMALRQAEIDGRLRSGDRVLLVGFGVGMSWGSCVITWQPSS